VTQAARPSRRWARPFDRLPSIRAKLGAVIVFAVAVTIAIMYVTVGFALRQKEESQQFVQLQAQTQSVAAGFSNGGHLSTQQVNRLLTQYQRRAVIVETDGTVLFQQFPTPTSSALVLQGQAIHGTSDGLEYYGVPVVRESHIIAAVFLARPQQSGGLVGASKATISLLKSVWWQLLLAGAISAAIALALARVLARGMTQPIRDMAAAAQRLSRGEYDADVPVESRDELGRLAETFNRMAGELESLERLRRDLVANVSHELKTPISALRAHLENLLDGVEEPNRETLQLMLGQAERLSRLIAELLDLSRLESGAVTLQLEPVRLEPLVDQVAREVKGARDHGVLFRNRVAADLPPVDADRERLYQVLFNLLDNAYRFTPAGGSITVDAVCRDDECAISVEDTGPGIPEEHIKFVFERFYRVDRARARGDGGTGIGLTIAKSVVEAHGGRIWAEPAEGGGCRFTFVLPMPATTGDAEPEAGTRPGRGRTLVPAAVRVREAS